MQTALHITALCRQLRAEIAGGTIVSTEFYKKQRAAYFFVRQGKTLSALGFVYHPAGTGCFCVPASKIKMESREKPWPVFNLEGAKITEVRQVGLDRIFELVVDTGKDTMRVVFEALGPNGNIWLVDDDGGKQATLRKRKFEPGDKYLATPQADRLNPSSLTGEQLVELQKLHYALRADTLARSLQGFVETMAREAIARSGLAASALNQLEDDQLDKLAAAVRELADRFTDAESGYYYEIGGRAEVYPFKLRSLDRPPEKFKTLSLAVLALVTRRQSTAVEADEEKLVLKAVGRAVRRQEKLQANVQADLDNAGKFEEYRRLAELLQLNRDKLRRGMSELVVVDPQDDTSMPVTIKLDPASAPNDNIDAYFKRHRKGREGLELLERRLEIVRQELASLVAMQSDLQVDFDAASQRYQSELVSLMPREADRREAQPRLPYREATLSTGLTIFIGRDGSDNDRTTFEFARPYELWFHTQQCPGSHVVIKYPNKSFEPSKREIEETAAIAAFHSKARRDSSVPVVYTRRKYVRKPRKAKPGLVTVEREKSVMVVPEKEKS